MHFMNPQRAQHMMPKPMTQPGAAADDLGTGVGSQPTDPNAGIGSAQSGYATPDNGPFECENCIHFQPPNACDNPQVVTDPEVNGKVEPEGCCNLFSPAGNETPGGEEEESEEHEHGEPGAVAG